jgi:hypothetical protein
MSSYEVSITPQILELAGEQLVVIEPGEIERFTVHPIDSQVPLLWHTEINAAPIGCYSYRVDFELSLGVTNSKSISLIVPILAIRRHQSFNWGALPCVLT